MTPSNVENRLDPRILTRIPAVVFGHPGAFQEVPMTTFNLSRGGALCDSEVAVPPGSTVKLRLDLEDPPGTLQPVVLEAIVLRVEGRGPFLVAFHFTAVPGSTADILNAYVDRLRRASSP